MDITPDSVATLLNSEDYGDRLTGINQLRQLDPKDAFPLIEPLVNDTNVRVRYAAVSQLSSLGEVNREKSLALLRDRLHNEPEADVQAAAADALGGLKLTETLDDLIQLYRQTEEWLVEFSIIACLGEMGDPKAYDVLIEALNSENNLVKTVAIGSLGELGEPQAVEALKPFINDPDWQVRSRLVQAFSRLGGEQAQALLQQLSNDEAEQVAEEAKKALN
ncbi:HEAT repeat domain-containing protein [Euhalothece natronophila Z-M001]|uniref:HEAT repeat domain-containing protein n=1 Tax=Euhalothece natronophila Z-M001 TaxID=522448 RepID=A0A5B8NMD1_9CHRO|nr:HEAT repeat domain-containing protein [Euhalothece natronophila]QDZ40204.1 HEAT repeat domain-containing protein [Euhalothece natronophila Z-M001]